MAGNDRNRTRWRSRHGLPAFLLMGFYGGKNRIEFLRLFDFRACGWEGKKKKTLDKCMFHQG